MKNIILSLLTIVVAVGAFSCSTGVETPETHGNRITAQSLQSVGIEHNEYLDKAYDHLKAKGNLEEGERSLKKFFIEEAKSNAHSEKAGNVAVQAIKRNFTVSKANKFKSTASLAETSDTLSAKVKSYLSELKKVLKSSIKSNVAENISALEASIGNDPKLTEKQLFILYSATQTATYSYKYWSENLPKWAELVKNKSKKLASNSKSSIMYSIPRIKGKGVEPNGSGFWSAVGDVAMDDAAGAMGGAIGAAALNLVPVGGQIAYADAIITVSAATSTISVVNKIRESIAYWY